MRRLGAKTDDLLLPTNQQIHTCFDEVNPRRTLVVMTIGGNDLSSIAEDGFAGAPLEETMAKTNEALQLFEDALEWLTDPVIFANVYEFTDGTSDTESCIASTLVGDLGGDWPDGRAIYLHWNEQVMNLAVQSGTDMIFMLEHFCGHGFHYDDPTTECYRGPDAERWFDDTCIHPNPTGHEVIAEMFMSVIDE